MVGVVGRVRALDDRPRDLVAPSRDGQRPHLETARLGVGTVGSRPIDQGVPVLRQDEVVGEHEEHAAPPGQGGGIGRGKRDARSGRMLVDGLDQLGTERAPVRDRTEAHALDHLYLTGKGHGLEPAAQETDRLDDGIDLVHADLLSLLRLRVGPELETRVPAVVDGVDQAVRVVALGVAEGELGVGRWNVVPLHERLLCHLPVGRQDDLLPPVHPHVGHAERIEQAGDGIERLQQGRRRGVQVDPRAAAPEFHPGLPQAQLAGFQQPLVEGVRAEDEGVRSIEFPPPAVEGADDPSVVEGACALGQLGGPVTTGVEIGPDRPFVHPDQKDRLIADRVFDVVAGRRDLFEPARHLPHVWPQPCPLEVGEPLVVVALGGDETGPAQGVRRVGAGREPWCPDRRSEAGCQPSAPPTGAPSMVMARSLKRHRWPWRASTSW